MSKRIFFMSAIAFAIALCSCSSDSGDDHPVIPITGAAPSRITPLNAWEGLQWSFDRQDPTGWLEAIGTTFRYLPDPVSAERYPHAFETWTRDVEREFIERLFLAGLVFHAQVLPDDFEQPVLNGTSIGWDSVEYSVRVADAEGASPVVFRGVANLEFRLEGTFWYLVSWEDVRGVGVPWNTDLIQPTLGELRATFRTE